MLARLTGTEFDGGGSSLDAPFLLFLTTPGSTSGCCMQKGGFLRKVGSILSVRLHLLDSMVAAARSNLVLQRYRVLACIHFV